MMSSVSVDVVLDDEYATEVTIKTFGDGSIRVITEDGYDRTFFVTRKGKIKEDR